MQQSLLVLSLGYEKLVLSLGYAAKLACSQSGICCKACLFSVWDMLQSLLVLSRGHETMLVCSEFGFQRKTNRFADYILIGGNHLF